MDLPGPILSHPERSFCPREPRVTPAAGRRDCRKDSSTLRIDLLDAILGELKQVLAVVGGSRMRGGLDRTQRLPAGRIEGVQRISRCKPDVLTVVGDSVYVVYAREGSIFTDNLGVFSMHAFTLIDRQRSGE